MDDIFSDETKALAAEMMGREVDELTPESIYTLRDTLDTSGDKTNDRIKALLDGVLADERANVTRPGYSSDSDVTAITSKVRDQFDVHDKNLITYSPEAQLGLNETDQERVKVFQDFCDDAQFVEAMLGRNPRQTEWWTQRTKQLGKFGQFLDEARGTVDVDQYEDAPDYGPEHEKAVFTTTTGADWVPTLLSSRFYDVMKHNFVLAPLLANYDMPTKAYDIPGAGSTEPVIYGPTVEAATITAGDIDDRKVTLTAQKLAARSRFTEEVQEDAITVDVLAYHKRAFATRMAEAVEALIVHADENDTQGQSGNASFPGRYCYSMWDGIHAQCISASTTVAVGGTLLDVQNLKAMVNHLDVYATPDAIFVAHPNQVSSMQTMVISEATGYRFPVWVNASGGSAGPMTKGPAGKLMGYNVYASPGVMKNSSTTGYYDGTTTDRTQVYMVNPRAIALGTRRIVTIRRDLNIENEVNTVVVTARMDLAHLYGTTAKTCAVCINVDLDAAPA